MSNPQTSNDIKKYWDGTFNYQYQHAIEMAADINNVKIEWNEDGTCNMMVNDPPTIEQAKFITMCKTGTWEDENPSGIDWSKSYWPQAFAEWLIEIDRVPTSPNGPTNPHL